MLNTLWTWGSALMPTVDMTWANKQDENDNMKLDDDWEILCQDEAETKEEIIHFQVVDQVPIGFVSLITKRHLSEFLDSYKNDLFCFWPAETTQSEHRGTIRCFIGRKPPAGYVRLDRLLSKPAQNEEFLKLLNVELDRLRQIEMRYPYSVSAELESPLLKGLLRWYPFVCYIWSEVVSNPWADFAILYPAERLETQSGKFLTWKESLECISLALSHRDPNHPKIFVNLIGPRNYKFQTSSDLQSCELEVHEFAIRNSHQISSSHFVCFPTNSTPS